MQFVQFAATQTQKGYYSDQIYTYVYSNTDYGLFQKPVQQKTLKLEPK